MAHGTVFKSPNVNIIFVLGATLLLDTAASSTSKLGEPQCSRQALNKSE